MFDYIKSKVKGRSSNASQSAADSITSGSAMAGANGRRGSAGSANQAGPFAINNSVSASSTSSHQIQTSATMRANNAQSKSLNKSVEKVKNRGFSDTAPKFYDSICFSKVNSIWLHFCSIVADNRRSRNAADDPDVTVSSTLESDDVNKYDVT